MSSSLRYSLSFFVLLFPATLMAQAQKQVLPSVTVVKPQTKLMRDNFIFSGTLIAREEVLVNHEIDGLRIIEILAEEGDKVQKGQVLLKLSREVVDVQLMQNGAGIEKAKSALAQAKSAIALNEAMALEARNAFERARQLLAKNDIAESLYDQRVAAFKSAEARLVQARDGLKLAEADLRLIEAQRAELEIRASRTELKAPVAGIISRRSAKLGQMVPGLQGGASEPLFRLIANGLVELEGEVLESRLNGLKVGQKAIVSAAGLENIKGSVRLVPSEVDKVSRLGRLRVVLEPEAVLRVGAYGRGVVTLQEKEGIVVPVSAVNFLANGTNTLQVVQNGKVITKEVKIGIKAEGSIEITSPLSKDELVILRAGPFLRDGDAVQTQIEGAK